VAPFPLAALFDGFPEPTPAHHKKPTTESIFNHYNHFLFNYIRQIFDKTNRR